MSISEELRAAREYEVQAEREAAGVPRPAFHLTPRIGWMNDPNGFSYYKGQYHLFYQYHPYDSHWGPMHWGHAVSTDLLHWTYLPAALAPDTPADRDGCFSGSAAALSDGRQLLLYTGVRNEALPDGTEKAIQTQCIAVGDGLDYEKFGSSADAAALNPEGSPVPAAEVLPGGQTFAGNPVITAESVPGGCWDVPLPEEDAPYRRLCRREWARADLDADAAMWERRILPSEFRDPKLLPQKDGSFRCIVAGGDAAHDGAVLGFRSRDALHWTFEGTLLKNWGRFGRMWECPDLFELDGKSVLLVSPQDMLQQGYEYHSGNGTVCFIGELRHPVFLAECDQAVDYGLDFYASQTVLTPDGRRVLIGWMQSWETSMQHPKERPWFGQMSIPRELEISSGRLIQRPVRELEALRRGEIRYQGVWLEGSRELEGVWGRTLDLKIGLDAAEEGKTYEEFSIRFAEHGDFHASVTFRPAQSLVTISRAGAGTQRDFVHEHSCLVRDRGGRLSLRIILDRFSVEVFVNGGEQVLSAAMYTDPAAEGIFFCSVGRVRMDLAKWDLVP